MEYRVLDYREPGQSQYRCRSFHRGRVAPASSSRSQVRGALCWHMLCLTS